MKIETDLTFPSSFSGGTNYCSPGCQQGYGDCNPIVTTTILATETASGTAAPTIIVCHNPNHQCINNATILCDTDVDGVTEVSHGDLITLLGCLRMCDMQPGAFVGSEFGAGLCACWEDQYGPFKEIPSVGALQSYQIRAKGGLCLARCAWRA
jgi:hypothetical protein